MRKSFYHGALALACLLLSSASVVGQEEIKIGLSLGKHVGKIRSKSVSLSDGLIATVSEDRALKIWEYPSATFIRSINLPEAQGNASRLGKCRFLNKDIVLVANDSGFEYEFREAKILFRRGSSSSNLVKSYGFYVVDWQNGVILDRVDGLSAPVRDFVLSPWRDLLLVSTNGDVCALYETKGMRCVSSFTFADEQVLGASFVGNDAVVFVLFLGVLRLPESPRFLVKHGLVDEARRVLGYIRNTKDEVEAELADIKNMTATEANLKEPSLATLFSDKYRYLVTAGVGVAAFQQFQGANAIFYYIPLIVEKATGQAASSQLMWPIIQGVLLVLGSLIFLVIADKFNRRTLLTVGGTIMGLSFILPAVINSIIPNADPMMIVFFLCIYVAFYSFTWAPLTWVIVGEIFPLAIRGRAAGLASSFNWIGSFLVGLLFPIMTASLSQATVFVIFGVICMLGVCFIRNCVPETRGHTL